MADQIGKATPGKTDEQLEKMSSVCKEIASDMAADASRFDGKPFNGRTVAEYFGNQGAAIAALAEIVDALIQREQGKGLTP